MSQLSSAFDINEFGKKPVAQIPWGTIVTIIEKSKTHDEMIFYINSVHNYGWSRFMTLNIKDS